MENGIDQVKSKQRVADHGEVFTAEREVNAMLDLVKHETERIESRFFEPACGTGNFLAEILRRKLAVVKARYGKHPADFERYAFLALSSIYGVELLEDNAKECRARLFGILDQAYTRVCKKDASDDFRQVARYVLERNILCGDALTLKDAKGEPIAFSEWSLVTGNLVQRRDFHLSQLLDASEQQMTIFMDGWEYDADLGQYIPQPFREFPLMDYREVQNYG
ncbi:MAG TPA: SAM-dependent DNA methyltransferase [Anaerolineaceae bacterium]|nr:SAM-dependent DNA methyltransferase [Anaerolineaceae bacterium]HNZ14998.1 SAM-dependent DNA methyltransferase [Anaerolineaceae bacterium]HOH92220.1 SAM-dependent DNA methyltransferase [Anaerolineaceae bacterium]